MAAADMEVVAVLPVVLAPAKGSDEYLCDSRKPVLESSPLTVDRERFCAGSGVCFAMLRLIISVSPAFVVFRRLPCEGWGI